MTKTKETYENYLNDHYDSVGFESTCRQLIYLTNPDRGKHISNSVLEKWIGFKRAGTLLRKYDPIAFNTGFNDWNRR